MLYSTCRHLAVKVFTEHNIFGCNPFVITNILISNITYLFSVTVMDYLYIYFVIWLCNSVTCNLLPNPHNNKMTHQMTHLLIVDIKTFIDYKGCLSSALLKQRGKYIPLHREFCTTDLTVMWEAFSPTWDRISISLCCFEWAVWCQTPHPHACPRDNAGSLATHTLLAGSRPLR